MIVNVRGIVLLAALLAVRCPAAEAEMKSLPGCRLVPTEWADGDSFRVRFPDGTEQTVRIYGADCIEWHVTDESDARRLRAQRRYFGIADDVAADSIAQARGFGEAAGKRTADLLAKPFTVHTTFADGRGDSRFQRIYGFVTTADGEDLASVLVREGLARAFGVTRRLPDGSSAQDYRARLEDLELTAATARRGIWEKTNWRLLPADRETERKEEQEIAQALHKPLPAGGLDLNSASRDELMLLPGIGETLAARIIEARTEGSYTSVNDLLRVRGISRKSLEAIAPNLRFSASSAPDSSSKKVP